MRTANRQNEVTGVSGAVTPAFDAAGNMTGDETGRQFTYDAWNRLVDVKSAGGVLLKSYAYDGLGRRVQETPAGGVATALYYSADWQVLEERVGGQATASYVWSPVYVDALVARDRDADGNAGTGANGREERLYVLADANYNVTAVVGVDGVVRERYGYDPFGVATVLNADGSARAGGSVYQWRVLFQGMMHDAVAGLGHQRARWYSPTLGRWATTDPIQYAAGDVNLYRMVGNGPTGRLDPSGLIDPKAENFEFRQKVLSKMKEMSGGDCQTRLDKAMEALYEEERPYFGSIGHDNQLILEQVLKGYYDRLLAANQEAILRVCNNAMAKPPVPNEAAEPQQVVIARPILNQCTLPSREPFPSLSSYPTLASYPSPATAPPAIAPPATSAGWLPEINIYGSLPSSSTVQSTVLIGGVLVAGGATIYIWGPALVAAAAAGGGAMTAGGGGVAAGAIAAGLFGLSASAE